jgi:hypothetical protein
MSTSDKLLEIRLGLLLDKVGQDISLNEAQQSLSRITGQWPGNVGDTFGIDAKNGGMAGIGRGEIALALTLAGVQSVDMSTFATSLTAEDQNSSPQRVTEILGVQGQGESFDVNVSAKAAAQVAAAITSAGGSAGAPLGSALGKNIEVKEPDYVGGKPRFLMAAEGQAWLNTSEPYADLVRLTSAIAGFIQKAHRARKKSRKAMFSANDEAALASLVGQEYASIFVATLDGDHKILKALPMIQRGEGTLGKTGLKKDEPLKIKTIQEFLNTLKAVGALDGTTAGSLKAAGASDNLRRWVRLASQYTTGLQSFGNIVFDDPSYLDSSVHFASKIVEEGDMDVSLFGDTPYLALVNSTGYDLLPADTQSLIGSGFLTLVGITKGGRPRWEVDLPGVISSGHTRDGSVVSESLLNLRVNLLVEELTHSDKKNIQRMIAKHIEADRSEQKKLTQKQFESELKKVLGKDLMGGPAKINRAIEEIAKQQLQKELKGRKLKDAMAEVTKLVLRKLYREMSYSYTPVIDRIKI